MLMKPVFKGRAGFLASSASPLLPTAFSFVGFILEVIHLWSLESLHGHSLY